MDNRTIYLIRHGRIQLEDEQRRFIGQLDLPLNAEGIKQAQFLQKVLGRADINAVYCSDLMRSRHTAEIARGNRAVSLTPLAQLREISMGEWEGCTFTDIARRFPQQFKERGADIAYYRAPGGESFADCGRRAITAFNDILETTAGNIMIVGHAGVNRLLFCHILGIPLGNLFRIVQDYGCLNVLHAGKFGYQVKLMNFPAAKWR